MSLRCRHNRLVHHAPIRGSLAMLVLVLVTTLARADDAGDRRAEIRSRFEAMEKALRGSDETLFRGQWHADGYVGNLVGGSGNTGDASVGDARRARRR